MESKPPVVILNEPQLAENIGSVARVMANFGLSELRLVRPRDGWPQERAWASASGADWPLDNAKVYERLEAAVAATVAAGLEEGSEEDPVPGRLKQAHKRYFEQWKKRLDEKGGGAAPTTP